uniref:Large subunit ribosomal protein L5e n=1 Tax=Tetraselmis sp. GSL018 TaxID=582737 RepID=A0A061RIY7_9CHLO
MGHAKVVKTGAYFSRYQVKFRRRRAGKTDYRARLRLCLQDKNKYSTPKYRVVVRFTNRTVICQLAYATITGDVVVTAANSKELPNYGLPGSFGLKNYAAAYATGLLLARRVLKKFGLDEAYVGKEEADGEMYSVEPNEEGPRPFFCVLDTGLVRTSTGNRVFGALKGCLDGGLQIPYSEKRFVGYEAEKKELDTEVLEKYIFNGHVAEYMEEMEEESPEKYQSHFAKYHDAEVNYENMEDIYKELHEKIREDPSYKKKERKAPAEKKIWKHKKLSYEQRKERLKAKLAEIMAGSDE